MKLRNGIIYITLAVILLVFSTMAAIYVHNMSKDLYKSQSQALKVKTLQYAKIAIISMKNWVDQAGIESGADVLSGQTVSSTPISNQFFIELKTPERNESLGFVPSLESVRIDNTVFIAIYENKETVGPESGSLYALIDSTQTNLLAPLKTTISVYGEQGGFFKAPVSTFDIKVSPDYQESVIYKFK